MAERFILVRHGEVEARYQKRLLGATDASLSPLGLAQAGALSRFLPLLGPDLCVTSPMKRCLETALPSRDVLNTGFQTDEDLREANFGEWETMGFDEIQAQYPGEISAMARFDENFVFPRGEPMKAFQDRIDRAVKRWAQVPEQTVALFTHAGFIRFAVCRMMGIDPRHHAAFEIPYASVVVIRLVGGKGLLQAIIPVEAMNKQD